MARLLREYDNQASSHAVSGVIFLQAWQFKVSCKRNSMMFQFSMFTPAVTALQSGLGTRSKRTGRQENVTTIWPVR
jgi:hypothetical protein